MQLLMLMLMMTRMLKRMRIRMGYDPPGAEILEVLRPAAFVGPPGGGRGARGAGRAYVGVLQGNPVRPEGGSTTCLENDEA